MGKHEYTRDNLNNVKVSDDVLNTSVALSVSEDGVPTFATMVSKEVETAELEAASGATFTDLRVGLFLVNESIAHELSKVSSSDITFSSKELHRDKRRSAARSDIYLIDHFRAGPC